MTAPTRPIRLLLASAAGLVIVCGAVGCDDKPADAKPAGEDKSVIEGGTPESEAGRKVEDAKRKIEAAEQQLQERDDRIFEQSAGEQAPRGVP